MAAIVGILIAFYLVFTQSVWIFGRILAFIFPVPYERELSFGAAAIVAGLAAGWMAHRYGVSAWRVGLLAGLAPVAAVLLGTTFISEFAKLIRETPPIEYALLVGEVALAMFACKLGALARAKVRGRTR